jgi:hypothetical protein
MRSDSELAEACNPVWPSDYDVAMLLLPLESALRLAVVNLISNILNPH